MKKRFIKLICNYGKQLCLLAFCVASLASEICRARFYQPEEPAGLEDFIRNKKQER